jgi:hypothetical protein
MKTSPKEEFRDRIDGVKIYRHDYSAKETVYSRILNK